LQGGAQVRKSPRGIGRLPTDGNKKKKAKKLKSKNVEKIKINKQLLANRPSANRI